MYKVYAQQNPKIRRSLGLNITIQLIQTTRRPTVSSCMRLEHMQRVE